MKVNLGHYEGEVEDINVSSKKFRELAKDHQELIILNNERLKINERLKEIEESINKIREKLEQQKDKIKEGLISWAWIWIKTKTNVKWKEEFIKICGKNKAAEVTALYKQKEYPQIGIRYVDPIPESIVQIKENKPQLSLQQKIKRFKLKERK